MQATRFVISLAFIFALSACAHANATPTRRVIASGGVLVTAGNCPTQRPAYWAKSKFSVERGRSDPTLDAQSGALVFEVTVDSMLGPQAAQVSLWNQTIRRDSAFAQSPIKLAVPVGRYSFRARKIGAQTMQDSVDVRSRYVDTVKVVLGREVVCLN